MKPDKDRGRVEDILLYADEVRQIVAQGQDAYDRDFMPQRAMEKCLQNIGEAANHLSQQFTDAYPHVPWAEIRGLRNAVAHEYGDIDYDPPLGNRRQRRSRPRRCSIALAGA